MTTSENRRNQFEKLNKRLERLNKVVDSDAIHQALEAGDPRAIKILKSAQEILDTTDAIIDDEELLHKSRYISDKNLYDDIC